MSKNIVGVFETEEQAVHAILGLQDDCGFDNDEISVIAKRDEKQQRIRKDGRLIEEDGGSLESAAGGAVAGGVIGGLGGLLLELGVLAMPGVGPILAVGPLAATIGGLIAGGATESLVGAFVDLGVSESDAKLYSDYVKDDKILVMVEDKGDDLVDDTFAKNQCLIRYKPEAE